MRKMKKKMILMLAMVCMFAFAMTGCANTQESAPSASSQEETTQAETTEEETEEPAEEETESKKPKRGQVSTVDINDYDFGTFEVTSEDLVDGVWNSAISNTGNGSNVSPQLSWEPVEGAESYVIYMVDTMAGNWIHWLSNNVTETELAQGWAPEGEYVGPYPPPGGSHTYEIYVVALKQPVEKAEGTLDASDPIFMKKLVALDAAPDGSEGNIIAYGHIVGTYTNGD